MNTLRKRYFLCGILILCPLVFAFCQTITSTRNGAWNDAATWGGTIPTPATASEVVIAHSVQLLRSEIIHTSKLLLEGSLTIHAGATLVLDNPSTANLIVKGTLTCMDSASLVGTTISNTLFDDGATYIHRQGPAGFVPLATWRPTSTFQISGFTTSGYINIAHSDGWKQHFGHVVYDCPDQSIFVVDLNGYLNDVTGNLWIRNTNGKTLRLATTQKVTINIGGNLIVEGLSEVWFSTSASPCNVHVSGNMEYRSLSSGPSYFTTRGTINFDIGGNLVIDSSGPLRMASSAVDSIGTRQCSLRIAGDLSILKSGIIAPPTGIGNGAITFNGTLKQKVVTASSKPFSGNVQFTINANAEVDLGTSVLSGEPGSLTVMGGLCLGSTDVGGAMQFSGGNINVTGPRNFQNGCRIEYNGLSKQFIGAGHPQSDGVDLISNNNFSVTLLADLPNVRNFFLKRGTFAAGGKLMTIKGNASFDPGVEFLSPLLLAGSSIQTIAGSGITISELILDKGAGSTVGLVSALGLTSGLSITSTNTQLNTNGYLTLLSTSDDPAGSCFVGPLPTGSAVEGDVTVQRFMSGEGRVYRYIGSPIENASVASLMDDFPVTGTFDDPSVGYGITAAAPSFFEYDESLGGLTEGWRPYPTSGTAANAKLTRGKGYAAFIRNSDSPTVIDYVGRLNQGDITMSLNFTGDHQPGNGWNLVGNPYASAIDWDNQGVNAWTKSGISQVISIRDNGAGGLYHYWDGDGGFEDIPGGRIAMGQSFWVRAMQLGASLTFREGVKSNAGAEFFRKVSTEVPGFGLVLSNDSLIDQVLFKVRQEATDSIDAWDGIKLTNDHLNIAFRHGNELLAIDASDRLPCGENIPISIRASSPGIHQLQLVTKGGTDLYDFWLENKWTNTVTGLVPNSPMEIDVRPDGFSSDSFSILIQPRPVDQIFETIKIRMCGADRSQVIIGGMKSGVEYSLYTAANKVLADHIDGREGQARISLKQKLTDGRDAETIRSITVGVKILCGDQYARAIEIETIPRFTVYGDTICSGQQAVLMATDQRPSDEPEYQYHWFETTLQQDTIFNGRTFVTGSLRKRAVYFVCATNWQGCTSELVPVHVEVINMESLDQEPGSDFRSPGLGCASEDTVAMAISGEGVRKEALDDEVFLFPNPAGRTLTLSIGTNEISGFRIIDASGRVVRQRDDLNFETRPLVELDVSGMAPGVYELLVMDVRKIRSFKFVKH